MKPAHFETRVTLYARAPMAALKALDRPGIAVCDVVRDAEALPERLRRVQPHVLVLRDPPPDAKGLLAEIARLCPAHPPRVVVCFAADFDVDAAGLEDLSALTPHPCAVLARPSLPARQDRARELLTGLGMRETMKGFETLALGAALLSTLPAPVPPLQYALYPEVARQAGISVAAAERRMRSAIESAWLNGNLSAQIALMGMSVSADRGKPTNSELLFRLADRVCAMLYTD